LQELMSQKPRPKGGIADTAEGVEFLGKTLSKEQKGSLMIVNSRLTDASRFEPFSIGNVGRDKRFNLISDYEQSLTSEFNKTVEFLKANPDVRLSTAQKDNIFYNLGVLRRISAEKNKLEKGIIEDGKKPSNVRDMEGNVLDPNEPIIGGTQVKESYKNNELMPITNKPTIEGQMEKINKASNRLDELMKEREAMYKPKEEKSNKTDDEIVQGLIDEKFGKGYFDTVEKPTFRLNVDKFKEDFNVSDEELQKILALSPEEQQKILQDYIDKDFGQRIELSDFDITDKEPNAQGGIVGLRIWSDK